MKNRTRVKRVREWLTPQEVGNMVGGYSAQFIRSEIKGGELQAQQIWSRAGKQGRWQIARAEAERYRDRLSARGPLQPTQTSEAST